MSKGHTDKSKLPTNNEEALDIREGNNEEDYTRDYYRGYNKPRGYRSNNSSEYIIREDN